MKKTKAAGESRTPSKGTKRVDAHIPGPASGWAVTALFGPGGVRWPGEGPSLRVVAVNPRRVLDDDYNSLPATIRNPYEKAASDD